MPEFPSKLRPQHLLWKPRGLGILTLYTQKASQLLWGGDRERTGLPTITTSYFIILHIIEKDVLPNVPGIPTTSLGNYVNNCSFPGLSRKACPLRRPPQLSFPKLEIHSCTLHCLWSGLLSRSPTVQTEWVSGQKQASPHAGKHKQITPHSPFLVKGSGNLRVIGQEEYHQTNGSCVCSTMKHEQLVSPGGFTVACPK